jgi:nucleotide-binding universal stress UspA family protein
MLTIDQRAITGPGTGAHPGDGGSSFRRILVPVRAPDESCPALAVAARICDMTGGVLRLVHVRTCDPPLRSAARFYRDTAAEAAAVLEEALLTAWACGGPRATTAVVDARRGDVATAIAWQASAWPADLIVLARRPRLAITGLLGGSVPDQVMRKAACPVLVVPPRQDRRRHHDPGPARAGHRERSGGPDPLWPTATAANARRGAVQ